MRRPKEITFRQGLQIVCLNFFCPLDTNAIIGPVHKGKFLLLGPEMHADTFHLHSIKLFILELHLIEK